MLTKSVQVWKISYDGIEVYKKHGTFTSYIKSKEAKEKEIEILDKEIKKWSYDTRKLPIYFTAFGLLITFGFGVNTCVNGNSNKSEIDLLKSEIKNIKDSISTYAHSQKLGPDTINMIKTDVK